MESGQRVSRTGRKLGSSRRRQIREPADDKDAPVAPEPEFWSPQAAAELQDFFQDCGAKERGYVTREDLAEAKFSFLGSEEESQMIFDWVDMEQRGRLSLEDFSSRLKNIFGSSLSTHRLRRRRPLPSQRVSATASFPALEEADTKEKEAFLVLMGQLGTSHLPEQAEIWRLWGELRQEEPRLAGNLEGFLAKMSHRLQEARADREALERSLRKRDSDHNREVRQLYEEMEQQIHREKQQLQAQSDSRGLVLSIRMQEVLEAKEREVQQLAEGQKELEAQIHRLGTMQQEADSENQQLREAERDLVGQLEKVRGQLQVTRGRLDASRGRVAWQMEEEPSVPRASEKTPDPQAVPPEEAPLPGLFGDNDDWDQLLSSFSSPPHRAPQLSWSPPLISRAASGPQTPRVVRQVSISESHTLPSGQEPSLDPDRSPSISPGEPSSNKDEKGVDPEGQATSPEQPIKPHGLEPNNESGTTKAHFPWGLPGAPAGESGSLVEDGFTPRTPAGPGKQIQASEPDDKGPGPGSAPDKPPRQGEALHLDLPAKDSEPGPELQGAVTLSEPSQGLDPVGQAPTEGQAQPPGGIREAQGLAPQSLEEEPKAKERKVGQDLGSEKAAEALETGHPESPQKHAQPAPVPSDTKQAPTEADMPVPSTPTPPRAGGPQEPTQALPTLAESEAQPRPPSMTAQAEREPSPAQSREPGAESRPEVPGKASGEARLTSPEDIRGPSDPDYLFHVIFVGDSNVGKTSFLHLLHQNTFAAGLAATVGVDFRVKTLMVDNKCFALQLWDTAGQERYHSLTRQLLRKAEGVVLMYDVTSQLSFSHVSYWLDCLQDAGADGAVILLLGNKMDCEEERQVPTEAGRQLAQVSSPAPAPGTVATSLTTSLKAQEDRMKVSLVEAAPQKAKRAGCCF
uniref:Ras-related protein Rab-44 n=1 Tax=Castor canadensis TaxID=51338 RepID=A0A8C0X6X3_CASCN